MLMIALSLEMSMRVSHLKIFHSQLIPQEGFMRIEIFLTGWGHKQNIFLINKNYMWSRDKKVRSKSCSTPRHRMLFICKLSKFKEKIQNKKSTIGTSIFVEGNLVAWKSKKLNVVSHYRVEPKYKIIANFACNYVDPHLMLKVGNK